MFACMVCVYVLASVHLLGGVVYVFLYVYVVHMCKCIARTVLLRDVSIILCRGGTLKVLEKWLLL